jgi:hypothetical protein
MIGVNKMNLYLISQNARRGYDTFDSAVVVADNPESAKRISPEGLEVQVDHHGDFFEMINGEKELCDHYSPWCSNIADVKVEYLGVADSALKEGIICASFNAG